MFIVLCPIRTVLPFFLPLRVGLIILIALLLSLREGVPIRQLAERDDDVAISSSTSVIPDLIGNPYNNSIDSRLRGNDKEKGLARNDKVNKSVALITLVLLIPLVLLVLAPYFRAELSYSQALTLLKPNPQQAYQKNLEAINFFPFKDSYHLSFSQISLAWANALAQNAPLTSDQKALVGQLLGQAINQAKLAVALAPDKASNLENLGLIYKNLIGVASDADRWSLAAFNSASRLDPINPVIQLEIGGVYYIDKNYDQASRFFQNALLLKPNYASAYYNFALSQRARGKNQEASSALKQAISLLTPGSPDYIQAQKQLTQWETAK